MIAFTVSQILAWHHLLIAVAVFIPTAGIFLLVGWALCASNDSELMDNYDHQLRADLEQIEMLSRHPVIWSDLDRIRQICRRYSAKGPNP